MKIEGKEYFTVKEAASALDVSRMTIYRKLKSDDLKGVKKKNSYNIGQWYIEKDSIKELKTIKNNDVIDTTIDSEELLDNLFDIYKDNTNNLKKELKKELEEIKQKNQHLINQLVKQNLNLSKQVADLSNENQKIAKQNQIIMKNLIKIKDKIKS